MTGPENLRLDLTKIIERFPGDGVLIRRLALRNEAFRGICEEYVLARASLSWFEARSGVEERPEVADYRAVIASLEEEVSQLLQQARG